MDAAEITMRENILKNYGKPAEEWIELISKEGLKKHGEILNYLKKSHQFTHGYANYIAHKTLKSDAGSAEDSESLIKDQFLGKEHFRPLYESLLNSILSFGDDIELAPKKQYVSLRRKKQFAALQPTSKTTFDVQLCMKTVIDSPLLQYAKRADAMFSCKISLKKIEEVTPQVLDLIKLAYQQAE